MEDKLMPFTLDWFIQNMNGGNQQPQSQQPQVAPQQPMQAPPQPMQQGSGRPPKVPGPRNPIGRQRVPQVPQQQPQSARMNRTNWIDWVDPNKGGGSFR